MNQETEGLSSKAGHTEGAEARSKRHPTQPVSLSTIGGWMILIAALAILLAAAIQVSQGSAILLVMIAVPILVVVLPSRSHLRLAFGRVVEGRPKDHSTLRTVKER
jgi:hypothetical protein